MTGPQHAKLKEKLRGVYTIFLTPFTPDLKVDHGAATENIDYLINEGVDGIVIAGTYGEYITLEDDERLALVRTAVAASHGRVPIVATTAAGSTAHVARLTAAAQQTGADAAMITPPYGMIEPTDKDVVRHFESIARGTDLPLLLYNNPNITPSLAPELLARLADIDGYVGIKQGATAIGEHAELIALATGRLRIFSGSDQSMVASLALGADGVSSTQSNFIPRIIKETYLAMTRGDLAEARKQFYRWAEFRRFARRHGQPGAAKAAVELLGRRCGPPRPPLGSMDAAQRGELADVLERMGVLTPATPPRP